MAIACLATVLYGCGSSGTSDTGATPVSTSTNSASATSPLSGATGSLNITHQAPTDSASSTAKSASASGTSADDFISTLELIRFTGLDAKRAVIFGPVAQKPSTTSKLTGVPVEVKTIVVEYQVPPGLVSYSSEITVGVAANTTVNLVAAGTQTMTVDVVNDSGLPDTNVYVIMTVKTVTHAPAIYNCPFVNLSNAPQTVTSSPLTGPGSTLVKSGTTIPSKTQAGKKLPVYQFTTAYAESARVLISYGQPIRYVPVNGVNADPTAYHNVRYDKLEFTYNSSAPQPAPGKNMVCYADLTSLDFFGIPFQFDALDTAGNVADSRSFRASTNTILNKINNLRPPVPNTTPSPNSTMDYAFLAQNPTASASPIRGYQPAVANNLASFLRVLSPGTTSADLWSCNELTFNQSTSYFGRPYPAFPYPSFKGYLKTMLNQQYVVSGLNGVSGNPPTSWNYLASVSKTGQDFTITSVPNTAMIVQGPTYGPPQGIDSSGNVGTLDANLPVTVTLNTDLPTNSADFIVYNQPATGFYAPETCGNVKYLGNSVYAVIGDDVLAGMQLGYVNGNYGNSAASWYAPFPPLNPFALARNPKQDDGLYNPYAAVIFNTSDAYGFAFSDRLTYFGPLLVTTLKHTRITCLNDARLDAPTGVNVQPSSTAFAVSWNPVAGADGYTATASTGASTVSVDVKGTTSATLPGLTPGVPYLVKVKATTGGGVAKGGTESANSIPVLLRASGNFTPVAQGAGNSSFPVQLNWPSSFTALGIQQSNYQIAINGLFPNGSAFNQPVTCYGVNGQANAIPFFIVSNLTGSVVDQGNFVVTLSSTGSVVSAFMTDGSALASGQTTTFELGPTRVPKQVKDPVFAVANPPIPPVPSPTITPQITPNVPSGACSPSPLPTPCIVLAPLTVQLVGCQGDTGSWQATAVLPDGTAVSAPAAPNGSGRYAATFQPGQILAGQYYWIYASGLSCGQFTMAAAGGYDGTTSGWSSSTSTSTPGVINLSLSPTNPVPFSVFSLPQQATLWGNLPTPTNLTVTGPAVVSSTGTPYQYKVVATINGTPQDITALAHWSVTGSFNDIGNGQPSQPSGRLLSVFTVPLTVTASVGTSTGSLAASGCGAITSITLQAGNVPLVGGVPTLPPGLSGNLAASAATANGCTDDVTGNSNLVWTSSNPNVVNVSNGSFPGQVSAGNSPGTAIITGSYNNGAVPVTPITVNVSN